MVVGTAYVPTQIPSSSDSDEGIEFTSEATTPLTPTSPDSPVIEQSVKLVDDAPLKKKKKKKAKKKAKGNAKGKEQAPCEPECRPPVLCISRNKHWRYISSYHVSLFALFGDSNSELSAGTMAAVTS